MESSSPPPSYFSTKVIFILFGVASLLGWNALLTELGFFNHFIPRMKPYTSFSFLNYFLNIVFQFLIFCKRDLFSLRFQLIGGIIGSIVFLILIPLSTILLGKDEMRNVIITGGLVVLMGFINALCCAGFFGLAGNFPLEMIVALSSGQGFSGIAMNIIQYICVFSISSEDDKGFIIQGIIFFIVSILILVVCLLLLLINFNKEYFQYYLRKSKMKLDSKTESEKKIKYQSENEKKMQSENQIKIDYDNQNKNDSEKEIKIESENQIKIQSENQIKNQTEEKKEKKILNFWELFIRVWDLDLIVLYVYVVTFALFPNASINQKLFGLSPSLASNTIILIYNVFDTSGRYLVAALKQSKKLNMIIAFVRSILLFTLVFNYYCQDGLEWNVNVTSVLLIINIILLASTNGIGVTMCFGLAPSQVEDEYKGQAGTSISFFLIMGIFLGSCIAFGTTAIIDTFRKPIT